MPQTADFPQADRLLNVGLVANAVANGHTSDAQIISMVPGLTANRQGRYYRLAAEILGLVTNTNNKASLTSIGDQYVKLAPLDRIDFLAQRLVDTEVFREGLDYIRVNKPNEMQLKAWFLQYYPGAETTALRRWMTYISYMKDSGLLVTVGGHLALTKFSGSVAAKTVTPAPTKSLTGGGKPPGAPPSPGPGVPAIGTYDVDLQKLERANKTHWSLVDGKSRFLLAKGLQPLQTTHIDLFVKDPAQVVIYEMKSVTDSGAHLLSQVRKAVAQLLEYRYVYSEPLARLCIVTNKAPGSTGAWILDYLAGSLGIAYESTSDFKLFSADANSRALLGSVAP